MAGPWEKYANQSDGPWTKFAAPQPQGGGGAFDSQGNPVANVIPDTGKVTQPPMGILQRMQAAWHEQFPGQPENLPKTPHELIKALGAPVPPGFAAPVGPAINAAIGGVAGAGEHFGMTPTNATELERDLRALSVATNVAAGSAPAPATTAVAEPVGAAAKGAGEAAGKTAGGVGSIAADVVGGLGTHTGGESLRQAFKAGREGGEHAQLFLDSLRDNAPPETVVDAARSALGKMREARSEAYKSGMIDVGNDPTHLDFEPVRDALAGVKRAAEYEGKVVNPEAAAKLKEIEEAVADWADSDPEKFHTVLGFDALKQRIGAVLESTTPHTRAATIAGQAYNAVKDEIVRQAPVYGKVMKDYEEASSALRELESSLSLKDTWSKRGAIETALRKLQSVMRNNAHTNYGQRLRNVQTLDEVAGGTIMPQLAGQMLSSRTPRGLGPLAGAATAYEAINHPWALGLLPFQSPRLMGEAAYGLGRMFPKKSAYPPDMSLPYIPPQP